MAMSDSIVSMASSLKKRVHGQDVHMVLDCAGAALVLNGKLLMINTYLREDGQDDGFADIRAFLEAAVGRAQALNEATPATPARRAETVISTAGAK
jgi:hypothetical protein